MTARWVFDIERERMVWANDDALRLWSAGEIGELLARDCQRQPNLSGFSRFNWSAG
ncbi:hypothetical protein OM427_24020 [Halomonas sp. 18H]|uniref:hypothetical protein n=1 Tax=Halomonas almeriensis TaxID=308163 RepID=UPI00222E8475|nr:MULTISPECIES: hypothetical protein [Halomonas]MCW4152583.1 hypothetical protein [Halomonas sp. 18H]MDN3553143.1 hypothetical protein [Halomonas almeriensis]